MRTDLTRFCVPCGLRLPRATEHCPRCGGVVVGRLPIGATPQTKWVGKADAWRSLIMWWPALIVYLLSGAGAVHLVFFQTPNTKGATLHAWVIGAGLMGGFLGVAIILGLLWAAWAVVVMLAFYFIPKTPAPKWFSVGVPKHAVSWTKARLDRVSSWFERLGWRSALLPLLAWLGLELLVQLITDPGWFVRTPPKDVAVMSLLTAVGTIVSFALLVPGLALAFGLLSRLTIDLERTHANLRLFRRVRPQHLASFDEGRPAMQGPVAEPVKQIAPISGVACAGFRLTGEVDGFQLDDSWLSDFIVESSASSARIATHEAMLFVETGPPQALALDLDQRRRLVQCLEERGLPNGCKSVRLAEARIEPGASVRVWGVRAEEREDAPAGYRDRSRRAVVAAPPGQPLVIIAD